ncbi:brain-specific serine protease 4 [Calliopsis andreniformis]|uniref:brain-specific serine protease 4 n=1 Tax=Calliopsis andreniformis TaxID=337506 RepID=UPI003FCE44D6
MVSLVVKTVLLAYFLELIHVNSQSTESCVPHYFNYVRNQDTGETSGRIKIDSSQVGNGTPLRLSVTLSIGAVLPTTYVGKIKLAKSKEQSMKGIEEGRPLEYDLYFPLPQPIPKLTALWFNSRLICTGPRETGPVVTAIVLNHTLGISQHFSHPIEDVPLLSLPSPLPLPTPSPIPSPSPSPPPSPATVVWPIVTSDPNVTPNPPINPADNDCGKNPESINLLIVGGDETQPNDWPWKAAIFINLKKKFEYHCGGTLVSKSHVITAAHCVYERSTFVRFPSGVFLVSLGRYVLQDMRERGSVNVAVAQITVHPDYETYIKNSPVKSNADSDLAVFILQHTVEYSIRIKPICLWSGSVDLRLIENKIGYVVGWGSDGNKPYTDKPRKISSHVIKAHDCVFRFDNYRSVASNRTFCGGHYDGTIRNNTPCNGDSGSGFIMYNERSKRYFLRGIVSRTVSGCVEGYPIIYLDVAQYLDWINQLIYT